MAPQKESLERDWKRLPYFNSEALVQKQLKRQMEARYIKSHTEQEKAYQQVRNVYLYKLNRAKCLYLNAAIEDTQGDQQKLFGLLDFLTKEPGGNPMPPGSDVSLAEGFASFFLDNIKTICKSFNPEDYLSVPNTFPMIFQGLHPSNQPL